MIINGKKISKDQIIEIMSKINPTEADRARELLERSGQLRKI